MALVHCVFLSGGRLQHLFTRRRARLRAPQQGRKDRTNRNSLSDRERHLNWNPQGSRTSSLVAGNHPLVARVSRLPVVDSRRLDRAVRLESKIAATIRKIPRGKVATYGSVARA